MKTILCFGDSNTYGYIPDGSGRFPIEVRWTGRLQNALGDSARVIEEGLCGRTTIFPDEVRDGRRGIDMIGTLVESDYPVDLLVVMLGTNDCKSAYLATAEQIREGVCRVIERAKEHAPESMKVLLISPIHLGKGVGEDGFDPEFNENSENVAKNLAEQYAVNKASYESQLEKLKIDLASIDNEQKNIEEMFLEYVRSVNANIAMIDKNSTISVRGRNIKMLKI